MKNDEIAAILFRIANCVQYFEKMSNLHDCNDCPARKKCEYLPKPGEYTRINCPLWGKGSKTPSEQERWLNGD